MIYSPPECLPKHLQNPQASHFTQTPKIDVYSFGVLLCEVVTRTLPEDLIETQEKLKKMWPSMYSLADACVSYDPNHRLTIAEVLTSLRVIPPLTKFEH